MDLLSCKMIEILELAKALAAWSYWVTKNTSQAHLPS